MSLEKDSLLSSLDTLREVANVAAAHAATALSRMTDRSIMISVSDLLLAPSAELPGPSDGDPEVLSVEMRILGNVRGRILYVMPKPDAGFLANFLLGRASLEADAGDGLTESCLQETANILGGAYTGALARMTGQEVMLSVPMLRVGNFIELVSRDAQGAVAKDDLALSVVTQFELGDIHPQLGGRLVLVSDPGSLEALIEAVRLTEEKDMTMGTVRN